MDRNEFLKRLSSNEVKAVIAFIQKDWAIAGTSQKAIVELLSEFSYDWICENSHLFGDTHSYEQENSDIAYSFCLSLINTFEKELNKELGTSNVLINSLVDLSQEKVIFINIEDIDEKIDTDLLLKFVNLYLKANKRIGKIFKAQAFLNFLRLGI